MKRIRTIITILLSTLILSSCDYSVYPTSQEQNGYIWLCEDYKIYFIVIQGGKGILFDEKHIRFTPKFQGDFGEFVDTNKIYDDNYTYNEAILFKGKNKFNKKTFTITVTHSNIDLIKIDDKITFNRVDKLPDWALEMESEASAEASDSS